VDKLDEAEVTDLAGRANVKSARSLSPGQRLSLTLLGIPLTVLCPLLLTAALISPEFSTTERVVAGILGALLGAIGIAALASAVKAQWSGLWKWIGAVLDAVTN
jgi:hypothetical protein